MTSRFGFLLLGWLTALWVGAAEVTDVRVWADAECTRLVLDLDAPVEHKLFTLSAPDRVVVDLEGARLRADNLDDAASGPIRNLRHGVRNGRDLRLVIDLSGPVKPRSFLLKPDQQSGHRLVVDLETPGQARRSPERPTKSVDQIRAPRDLVIAVDPGHGGKDPGARGSHGTNEKQVVLEIARRLARHIDQEPGMRAIMTRDGDRFLSLRQRMDIARDHDADLFVSIHADAFRDRRVQGSSVYVLSRRGASSEMARILAQSENAADLAGGVSLNDKDELLRSVILDLSQSASIEASLEVADNVLQGLKQVGKVHKDHVQQAGFVVLKSPDIPSILVETAFISNPSEERKLKQAAHQDKLARAMLAGIRNYFYSNPPPGTYVAMHNPREHVIRRGDTLSEIASRYNVSLRALRATNGLNSDRVYVGQTLRIPGAGEG
ncbi:N-acetylmuramoyl-L-alanine amidase [Thiohalobacter thiocyanaticus]|uniref:N-acetylmuramoyl-L-alanine amidase AmiC n=1 Tax=Thiohalobacter thiocyanaticus TaxID=585455 RepID=A0A1Z4VU01_9GAMM|nr:N-acetylmuramoyl-L-alanine amidase [Thiohalobacter thiocyanaticus]BAZ94872.1 N-acetylmuramoyl-L-alanine amidase [Thiohalobacter thiocyanaticus]